MAYQTTSPLSAIAFALAMAMVSPTFAADATKETALNRFMAVSNADGNYGIIVQQARQSFIPLIQMNPTQQDKVIAIIEAELTPPLKAGQPVFLAALRTAYDKRFTTAELNQLADFMATPVWLKLNQTRGEVLPEAAKSLTALQESLNTKVGPAVLAKMKAAGLVVPKLRPAKKGK